MTFTEIMLETAQLHYIYLFFLHLPLQTSDYVMIFKH